MWTILLLAATVRSFAHMPLGISDRNSILRAGTTLAVSAVAPLSKEYSAATNQKPFVNKDLWTRKSAKTNFIRVRAKRLALAWQLKLSGSFSRELEQYSHNKAVSLLVAFGENSISTCNDDLPRKQPLRWATPQTYTLVPQTGNSIRTKTETNSRHYRIQFTSRNIDILCDTLVFDDYNQKIS